MRTGRRNHLAPFTNGPGAWMVVARNAIPVVGVYALGWSSRVAVFEIWFDGATALAVMLALQMRAFARNDPASFMPPGDIPRVAQPLVLALVWGFLVLLVGAPYWFTLAILHLRWFGEGFLALLLDDTEVMAALALVLASNTIEELRRGYGTMSDSEIRREFDWHFHMHLARISATLLVAFLVPRAGILALAIVLSYVEIYPMRSLRLLGGDQTLDSENASRSRD